MSRRTAERSTTVSKRAMDSVGSLLIAGMESMAQLSLGQGILKMIDRFLWVVEKSAQWSLPVQEMNAEENGKTFGRIELVRPLPWILFLPGLVILRALRFAINVGAFILGYPSIQPIDMVKIVQKSRRRLRAIKSTGVTNMRQRRASRSKEEELLDAEKSLINSMLATLSALSCLDSSPRTPSPPPTRIYVRNEPDTTPTPEEQSTTESTSPEQITGKRKYSQVTAADDTSDEEENADETFAEKLDRMAAAESEDEDYTPADEDLISDNNSTSSEDLNDSIDENEVEDLKRDNFKLHLPHSAVEIIVEESESTEDTSALHSTPITSTSHEKNFDPTTMTSLDSGTDTGPIFYSPINSTVESVDALTTTINTDEDSNALGEATGDDASESRGALITDGKSRLDNGDFDTSWTSTNSGNSTDGTANGSTEEKRNLSGGKGHHHKGKKNISGQRKKK